MDGEGKRQEPQRVGDPDAGAVDPAADDPAAGIDVREFARTGGEEEEGSEAALGGGAGDLGAGGDLAGDFGGLDDEAAEGTTA